MLLLLPLLLPHADATAAVPAVPLAAATAAGPAILDAVTLATAAT